MNCVPLCSRAAAASAIHSHTALVCPRTFFGLTALSVETRTKRLQPNSEATSARTLVPKTLFRTDSIAFASMSGTCL